MDRTLTCRDCGQQFVFTAGEQAFYQERGFSDPQRCPSCRQARKQQRSSSGGYDAGGYGGGSYGGGGGGYGGGGGQRPADQGAGFPPPELAHRPSAELEPRTTGTRRLTAEG